MHRVYLCYFSDDSYHHLKDSIYRHVSTVISRVFFIAKNESVDGYIPRIFYTQICCKNSITLHLFKHPRVKPALQGCLKRQNVRILMQPI